MIHKLIAWMLDYGWFSCALCDQQFGGHQVKERQGHQSSTPQGLICPGCTKAARGCRAWAEMGHHYVHLCEFGISRDEWRDLLEVSRRGEL